MRAENGLPLREFYGIINDLDTGIKSGEGRILIQGTTINANNGYIYNIKK